MRVIRKIAETAGAFLEQTGKVLLSMAGYSKSGDRSDFACFFTEKALKINDARLEHLASLNLPLKGKRVLEIGAGVGLHTSFLEQQGCNVVSTDGRKENVEEMKRRHPERDVRKFDLMDFDSYESLGAYDVVYCYGILYHTPKPGEILARLSSICSEMILLETCVTPGVHSSPMLVRETESFDQAIGLVGCRPTRPWIMEQLRAGWGHSYATVTQPNHPDFDLEWEIPFKRQNHRAVFVGSRTPLNNNPLLCKELPDKQIPFELKK